MIVASIAAIAASTSAFFATRTFRIARKATIRDKFISAVGDLVSHLFEMSRISARFNRHPELIPNSRDIAESSFQALDAVVNQLRILEPSLKLKAAEDGDWLLEQARSLGVDVLQSDEWADDVHDLDVFEQVQLDDEDEPAPSYRLAGISDDEWQVLRRSTLYTVARLSEHEAPTKVPPYMTQTFEQRLRKYALDTNDMDYSYNECCRRVIDDFVSSVIVPWSAHVVKHRLS
ncbi:hypothetical protein [Mycobacterium sp. C31M]